MLLDCIKIVLVETSHPGNIGATARAMKTMGLNHLCLVAPKQFPHPEATALSSGAEDVLLQAKVYPGLAEAIADCHFVYGTTARPRDLTWPMMSPSEMASQIKQKCPAKIAIVFGRERTGLTNDELWLCQAGVMIPTSSVYRSLNLSQAVQIIAYELFKHLGEDVSLNDSMAEPLVNQAAMTHFYKHLEEVLIAIDFMQADEPKRLMPKLKRLFNRIPMYASEMNILRGILTQIMRKKHEQTNLS
jgi:tRNA (cytidine32/uridine32-2'-O)-methyltransferase